MTVAAWRTRKTPVVRVAALMLYTPGVPFIGVTARKTKTTQDKTRRYLKMQVLHPVTVPLFQIFFDIRCVDVFFLDLQVLVVVFWS
jgi:hypothetical protein